MNDDVDWFATGDEPLPHAPGSSRGDAPAAPDELGAQELDADELDAGELDDEATSVADAAWLADLRRTAAASGRRLSEAIDDESTPPVTADAHIEGDAAPDDEVTLTGNDVIQAVRQLVSDERGRPATPSHPSTTAAPPTPPAQPPTPPAPPPILATPTPPPAGPPLAARWAAPARLNAADEHVESVVTNERSPRFGSRQLFLLALALVAVFALGVTVATLVFSGDGSDPGDPPPTLSNDDRPADPTAVTSTPAVGDATPDDD